MSAMTNLKSDWDAFREQKQAQLRQLSQSLQAYALLEVSAVPASTERAPALAQPTANSPEPFATLPKQQASSPHDIGAAVARTADMEVAPGFADSSRPRADFNDHRSVRQDVDPLTHLNVIKLRLAKQIENADPLS